LIECVLGVGLTAGVGTHSWVAVKQMMISNYKCTKVIHIYNCFQKLMYFQIANVSAKVVKARFNLLVGKDSPIMRKEFKVAEYKPNTKLSEAQNREADAVQLALELDIKHRYDNLRSLITNHRQKQIIGPKKVHYLTHIHF
jgi:hypothetical protein